jgi:hypothetical protein
VLMGNDSGKARVAVRFGGQHMEGPIPGLH